MSRVSGIMYLFKYVCKGQDRVAIQITAENRSYEEISNFQHARYVSELEAAWRLYPFDDADRNPAVIRLAMHLPYHYTV